tara:strand:+ start:6716 stop:6973 length:258 start_codon:yes stop_codon:yes gene_type:complete
LGVNVAGSNRAKTVTHAEYELIKHIIGNIDVDAVKQNMVPNGDSVALKRFNTAGSNIKRLLVNLGKRRQHRLPKDHPDYNKKAGE